MHEEFEPIEQELVAPQPPVQVPLSAPQQQHSSGGKKAAKASPTLPPIPSSSDEDQIPSTPPKPRTDRSIRRLKRTEAELKTQKQQKEAEVRAKAVANIINKPTRGRRQLFTPVSLQSHFKSNF